MNTDLTSAHFVYWISVEQQPACSPWSKPCIEKFGDSPATELTMTTFRDDGDFIDLRSAQVYCVAIFLVSQEVSLNFHRFCG